MNFFNRRQPTAVFVVFCLLLGLSSCDSGSDGEQTTSAAGDAAVGTAGEPAVGPDGRAGRDVVTETWPYAEVDDQLVYGYFAFPADMVAPIPAIILIHDRWGLNESTQDMSRRLAAEGYIVVAIDLFDGETAASPSPARILEIEVFENPKLAADNIRQAYRFLKDTFGAPKVASIGFGFGGGWSLNAAMLLPDELSASVTYYGQVINDQEKLSAVQAPLLGLFAADDRVITAKSVFAFEVTLQALAKEFEIEIYSGVGRGFADPRSERYSAETAALAWSQTLNFLGRHMAADAS